MKNNPNEAHLEAEKIVKLFIDSRDCETKDYSIKNSPVELLAQSYFETGRFNEYNEPIEEAKKAVKYSEYKLNQSKAEKIPQEITTNFQSDYYFELIFTDGLFDTNTVNFYIFNNREKNKWTLLGIFTED